MKISGVIFDMDGVLIDSEAAARDCLKDECRRRNLSWNDEFYYSIMGTNWNYAMKLFTSQYGSEQLAQQLLSSYVPELYRRIKNGQVPFKKGALEIIDYLNQHAIPICLATSATADKIEYAFNSHGLKVPFEHYITGDEVTRSKPDPEIFLKAAGKINVPIEECLVIEDSYQGVTAAYNAKAIVTMVPDLIQPDEQLKKKITFLKSDLLEVLELIKQTVAL